MLNYDNTGVTVELGELIESGVKLWDFDYPVPRPVIEYNGKSCTVDFDKAKFEQKVIDHYYFRQIGQETVGRFLHYFRSRIREIMPYYVQVYEFDAKFRNIDDPLESYNLVETFQQETAGTGMVTGSSQNITDGKVTQDTKTVTDGKTVTTDINGSTTKFSDTPQGTLSNLDTHLTNATQVDGTNDQTVEVDDTVTVESDVKDDTKINTTSTQSTEDIGTISHTLTRRGNIGVQPLGGEVENIRSAFINIDMQIIDELKDLFLMVY